MSARNSELGITQPRESKPFSSERYDSIVDPRLKQYLSPLGEFVNERNTIFPIADRIAVGDLIGEYGSLPPFDGRRLVGDIYKLKLVELEQNSNNTRVVGPDELEAITALFWGASIADKSPSKKNEWGDIARTTSLALGAGHEIALRIATEIDVKPLRKIKKESYQQVWPEQTETDEETVLEDQDKNPDEIPLSLKEDPNQFKIPKVKTEDVQLLEEWGADALGIANKIIAGNSRFDIVSANDIPLPIQQVIMAITYFAYGQTTHTPQNSYQTAHIRQGIGVVQELFKRNKEIATVANALVGLENAVKQVQNK